MNETMEKLLAAARQGAAQAGDLAVNTAHGLKKKAGETLSAAKQRLRIAALKTEIAVLKGGPDRPVACAVCGTQSRPGDVFCRFCGGKL